MRRFHIACFVLFICLVAGCSRDKSAGGGGVKPRPVPPVVSSVSTLPAPPEKLPGKLPEDNKIEVNRGKAVYSSRPEFVMKASKESQEMKMRGLAWIEQLRGENYPPFLIACALGDLAKVKNMLAKQPRLVNGQWYDRRSPLSFALMYNHYPVAEYLIRNGADPNCYAFGGSPIIDMIKNRRVLELGMECLATADPKKNINLMDYFINIGADVNRVSRFYGMPLANVSDPETMKHLIRRGANVNLTDEHGNTPLHLQDAAMCKILLENGADPNRVTEYGETPLDTALETRRDPRKVDRKKAEVLRKHGGISSKEQLGVFSSALKNNNDAVVIGMLKNGKFPLAFNKYKNTDYVSEAVKYGKAGVVKYFIGKTGASKMKAKEQMSLLTAAVMNNRQDMLKMLLDSGFRIQRDHHGRKYGTLLCRAAENDNYRMLDYLKSVKPPSANNSEDSALKMAVEKQKYKMVSYLIEKGIISKLCLKWKVGRARDLNDNKMVTLLENLRDPELESAAKQLKSAIKNDDPGEVINILKKHPGLKETYCSSYGSITCEALAEKSEKLALYLINNDFDIPKGTGRGSLLRSYLGRAIRSKNLKIVKLLVAKGAPVTYPGKEKCSTFIHMAACSTPEIARFLIEKGAKADINRLSFWDKETPLHMALKDHKYDIMEVLLKGGADVNARDYRYMTPLMRAQEKGNDEGIKLLKKYGAKEYYELCPAPLNRAPAMVARFVVGKEKKKKYVNVTPAEVYLVVKAVRDGDFNAVKSMLQKNPDLIRARDTSGVTVLHMALFAHPEKTDFLKFLVSSGCDVNARDRSKATPLHYACYAYNGGYEGARFIISAGAKLNLVNKWGQTPLHSAVVTVNPSHVARIINSMYGWQEHRRQNLNLIRFLILKGGDPNIQDEEGRTPLHAAIKDQKPHAGVVKILVDAGAKVNLLDQFGRTPLSLAFSKNEARELVPVLIKAGADVCHGKSPYTTPVVDAADTRDDKVREMIVAALKNPNYRFKNGITILHLIVARGYPSYTRAVIKKGGDVNARDKDGKTPLHHLAQGYSNYTGMVGVLTDYGAKINARDKRGHTPLWYAKNRRRQNVKMIVELEKHGARE